MKPPGHRPPPGDMRPRAVRFGLWRALAAAPAMAGSVLLLMLASAPVGRWSALCVLSWVGATALPVTRAGERMMVRVLCGFHRPGPAQEAALGPAWSTALEVTGTAAGDVELYVQPARALNASAAGGRSIAVTSRVVDDCATGRLSEDQLVAVLVHELGHLATGATRGMCLVAWLSAPWRLASRLLTGLASTLAGRRHRRGGALVVVTGLAVAATRAAQEGRWVGGGVLVCAGLAAVLGPLADAALSRRVEYAADRFAADHGLAPELGAALRVLKDRHRAPCGWSRLLSSHPTSEQRIRALQTATVALGPDGGCDPVLPRTPASGEPRSRAVFRAAS